MKLASLVCRLNADGDRYVCKEVDKGFCPEGVFSVFGIVPARYAWIEFEAHDDAAPDRWACYLRALSLHVLETGKYSCMYTAERRALGLKSRQKFWLNIYVGPLKKRS